MAESRRKIVVIAIVCLAVGAGVVAAAHIAGTAPISGGVPLSSADNTTIVVEGDTDALLDDYTILSGTVDLKTEDGNMTVYSAGDTRAVVDASEITGPWTNVTSVSADPNMMQFDPEDKIEFGVSQEVDSFSWPGSPSLDDGDVDFVYSSSGPGEVLIQSGLPTDTKIAAIDRSTNDILDVETSDSGGGITFDSLSSGSRTVVLQSAEDYEDPVLENPSPTGGLQSKPSQVSIDVSDAEMGRGDTVTVDIEIDGSNVKTTTITSNKTVTASIPSSGLTGGEHTWTVNASADYGGWTADTYSYKVPDTLYIRHELNHTDLVDSPISANGTFFGENQIFDKGPVTDGTINMTGLPVTEAFIVEVEASDSNYTTRTAYIPTIFQQQSAYLLDTNKTSTVTSRFRLNDPTGQYGAGSILYIQRPVNVSGDTKWRTIHGDEFGVEGVTATLEEGGRYRIKVSNGREDKQVIGPYRADVSESVEVEPGTPTIGLGEFNDGWSAAAELRNDTLEYRYSDLQNETDELTVWIHERGDKSNNLVANTTYFNLGNASAINTLTKDQTKKPWVVEFVITRNGEAFTHTITVSNRKDLFGAIGDNVKLAIGIGSLFMFAGAFSLLNAALGAFIVTIVGGLWWWIGLLDGATMGIAVVIGLLISVINWMRQGGSP